MAKASKIFNKFTLLSAFEIIFTALISCKSNWNNSANYNSSKNEGYEINEIKLTGEASLNSAELSGLTWFGDYLVLLPQYPFKIGKNVRGYIYKIRKERIIDYILGNNTEPIEPAKISIVGKGLERFNVYGEGYESIVFHGNDVYLTIEASENHKMTGYIVKGKINDEANEIVLDENSLSLIKPQTDIYNLSDETIFIYNNTIYTLYEANGKNINTYPVAHRFNMDLKPLSSIKLSNIEYRITDAAAPGDDGKYWAINYMYSGDWDDLNPAEDEEEKKFGQSNSLKNSHKTERLLQFQITDSAIVRTETPPLQLKILSDNDGRNWEGLVKLENYGFLLVTDQYPKTILGYLEYKGK